MDRLAAACLWRNTIPARLLAADLALEAKLVVAHSSNSFSLCRAAECLRSARAVNQNNLHLCLRLGQGAATLHQPNAHTLLFINIYSIFLGGPFPPPRRRRHPQVYAAAYAWNRWWNLHYHHTTCKKRHADCALLLAGAAAFL